MKLIGFVMLILLLRPLAVQAESITVTDLAGRNVVVNTPVSRMILADSRMLLPLSVLHPGAPLKNIIAWDDSLQTRAPDMGRYFSAHFPQLKDIPVFTNPYRNTFSVEQAIQRKPDLIVFDIGILSKLRDEGTLALLDKSNIPVIFIDFRQKPLTNTPLSLHLLGSVTGETTNAEKFLNHWQQLLKRTQDRVAAIPQDRWPSVVFENHAGLNGMTCCAVFGRDSFGEFIPAAGGKNIMADKVPPRGAEVSPELLIEANPDIWLLSGADWRNLGNTSQAVPLGYEATRTTTLPALKALMDRPMVNVIPATQSHRVMAIYHQFYDSPFNVIALEAMAKLFHPEQFSDVDPQVDLETLYRDDIGIPYQGLFFVQR